MKKISILCTITGILMIIGIILGCFVEQNWMYLTLCSFLAWVCTMVKMGLSY